MVDGPPPDPSEIAIEDKPIAVWGMDGTFRTNINFKSFWFEQSKDKDKNTWIFRGFFAHDLHHPHSKKVLIKKGEEVELREQCDEEDDDDW